MPVFNVAQTVVALIEADSEKEAQAILDARIESAGINVYGYELDGPDIFESVTPTIDA